jgi:hypothetical protein
MIARMHAYLSTSCAGLTRASITLQKDSCEEDGLPGQARQ